ncbi:hypothetical protein [Moorena sp. SIO4G3]|uniref:hypothetical protein n=1 Tax=Moorena sp. SIO4G3 TaxID=2607821 RepID=UPI00142B1337|nr:hypothetical protein [Moorena sp. SIO4G3]NEO77796.1 hypothetical protein [Moorena sp. SIO4G3]
MRSLLAIATDIKALKGSTKAQIWTFIGILITAVGGFVVAVGRFVISPLITQPGIEGYRE